MSDTGDLWREVRKERQRYKQNNRDLFLSFLDEIKDRHKVTRINEYQYRIDDKLDIYPSNKKWHLLSTNERGQFKSVEHIRKMLV